MLVAAALCPAAPVLVPEVGQRASAEVTDVRLACDLAVAALLHTNPSRLVVVSCGASTRDFGAGAPAGWHRLGVPHAVPPLGRPVAPHLDRLPLALTVGRWLLGRAGYAAGHDSWWTVHPDGARRWGAEVGAWPDRTALLVLGEGSASLGPDAPLPADPRAAAFDHVAAQAVSTGDAVGLGALDADLAAELGATGAAAWRALAAAVGDRVVTAGVYAYRAPYGVGYLVGSWTVG